MKCRLIILLLIFFFSLSAFAAQFSVDASIYQNSALAFNSHRNYLTMEINYPPVSRLYRQVVEQFNIELISRGEAHITVITPVEFDKVLKKKISIKEIEKIAKEQRIQESSFEVKCVGLGKVVLDQKEARTYFIVVQSDDLLRIRKEIKDLFVKNGGDAQLFDANQFYPHITLGFTKRDLHESDGVIKGTNSCVESLKL